MSERTSKGNDVVMDNKDSSSPIKKDNQSTLLSDNIITDTNFVLEEIEIKEEEVSFIIENEETESETVLLLSEPFTLKDNVNFVDNDFEEESTDKPDENNKLIQMQDNIENTVNNEMSLIKLSPNVDQVKSLVDETSLDNVDSGIKIDAEECAILGLNTNQVDKTTECTIHISQDNSKTHVVRRSIRNKRSLGTTNYNNNHSNNHTVSAPRHKKKKTEISTLSEITSSNQDSSEIDILGDNLSKNKNVKCMESTENNMSMETYFKIKPCSIVIEKKIANPMNAKDICKVSHVDNLKDCIVFKAKTRSTATSEFEVSTKAQPNVSFSKPVRGINNRALISGNFKRLKSDINSKYKHPSNESTSKSVDPTTRKEALTSTCEQNASSTSISLDSAQEANHVNLNITSSDVEICSTKDLVQEKYFNLDTQNLSGLKQNDVTDPKQTNDNSIDSLPLEPTIPKQLSRTICKKMMESKPQKLISSPDNNETEIKGRLIAQEPKEVNVLQINEYIKGNNAKVILPSHGNKAKIQDALISQQNPIENMKQLIENLKGNKAISLQYVNNNASLTPLKTTSPPTLLSPKNTLNSKTLIQNSCTSIAAPTLTSPKMLPKQRLNSKTESKQVSLEELLEGAPPFIQEVFKCDSIRDGFINEDLIFVLSLLPDMEEMAGREKLQFQLRIIETITDVFSDPVLKL